MKTTKTTVVPRAGGRGIAALARATYRAEATGLCRLEGMGEVGSPREDVLSLGHAGTDIVVRGWVYAADPSHTEAPFSVARVGGKVKRLDGIALGARTARVGADGTVRFSTPLAFHRVALDWRNAYGGTDAEAESLFRLKIAGYAELLDATEVSSLCVDPRNPTGQGFCVVPPGDGWREVALPTLEWRDARLGVEGFILGDPDAWCLQVPPCCTDAVQHEWFPRAAALGLCEISEAFVAEMTEAERAGLDAAYLIDGPATMAQRGPHPSFFRVATAALQWDALQPGEAVRLVGMRPGGAERVVTLPRAPEMGAAGWAAPGRAAVVEIDAEAGTMEVLWVAEDPSAGDDHSAGWARWQEG